MLPVINDEKNNGIPGDMLPQESGEETNCDNLACRLSLLDDVLEKDEELVMSKLKDALEKNNTKFIFDPQRRNALEIVFIISNITFRVEIMYLLGDIQYEIELPFSVDRDSMGVVALAVNDLNANNELYGAAVLHPSTGKIKIEYDYLTNSNRFLAKDFILYMDDVIRIAKLGYTKFFRLAAGNIVDSEENKRYQDMIKAAARIMEGIQKEDDEVEYGYVERISKSLMEEVDKKDIEVASHNVI